MNDRFFWAIRVFCVVLWLTLLPTAYANEQTVEKLHIAVAANFLPAFEDLQTIYEEQTGVELIASSGSTGQLYHQIRFGAPFDIFLSADSQTSERLIKEDKAKASSYFTYAHGRLVLWSKNDTLPLENGVALRQSTDDKRIGIANPKTAPYGKAAQQVLVSLELDKQWRNNMITGQNVSQTHQFVASGNVDMGFVSLAQLRFFQKSQTKNINYWLIPQNLHQPIEQTAVLLNAKQNTSSKQIRQAMHFLSFLKTPTALAVLKQYGYE